MPGDDGRRGAGHLAEAAELFFEVAGPEEIARRVRGELNVTQVEVAVG